jgi:hypothetical protein
MSLGWGGLVQAIPVILLALPAGTWPIGLTGGSG